ncbi:uncharacterized protein M6B38_143620 [Iris pallida]|uniref:Uncharacterized protein n=1 Tax=Iris pallida TaxID=29817 RepID=A0AAX6FC12_IRIPA|nr:uncharacterized protein M6B38_143620 [Iris pallida]
MTSLLSTPSQPVIQYPITNSSRPRPSSQTKPNHRHLPASRRHTVVIIPSGLQPPSTCKTTQLASAIPSPFIVTTPSTTRKQPPSRVHVHLHYRHHHNETAVSCVRVHPILFHHITNQLVSDTPDTSSKHPNTTITKTKSINATTTDTYLQTMPTTDLRLPFRVDLIDKLHHSDALDPTASCGDHRTPAITSRLHRRGGELPNRATPESSRVPLLPPPRLCRGSSSRRAERSAAIGASSIALKASHRLLPLSPEPRPPTLSYPSWPIPAAPPSVSKPADPVLPDASPPPTLRWSLCRAVAASSPPSRPVAPHLYAGSGRRPTSSGKPSR